MAGAYAELAPPRALLPHLACLWESHDDAVNVLPDGCVDIVHDRGRLIVAGPATIAKQVPASPGQPRFGVRFRIGLAGSVLGLPAWEVLDRSVPLDEIWGRDGRRLEDAVARAAPSGAGLTALVAGVAKRVGAADERDRLLRAAVVSLLSGTPVHRVSSLVALGERQLRRRFHAGVGYGPATLLRVQRFQSFLGLARRDESPASLARLAADSGYADQAHLARECRRLSGLSPALLLSGGATDAGEKSVLFKPAGSESVKLAA